MESSTPAFAVTLWEETEGPLARTESGQSLPVSSLDIQRRQIPVPGRAGIVLGTYADGRPFLVRQTLGRGGAFALSTAAQESWSSLAEGTVLVPLIQRMLTTAAQQRRPASMAVAGEWKPDADEAWIPVTGAAETERSAAADARKPALADPRWRAGVYQFGGRWMALNRPDIEDETPLVPASELHGMLPLIPIRTLEQAGALSSESLQKELWPALSALLVLTLLVEMALCGIESRTAPPHALAKKSSAP
jgi:hypothetical protein